MMDAKQLKEATFILSRAKIAMLEKHPFYAHILTHLQFEFVESLPGGSPSATDGKKIYIVPDMYLAKSKGQQITTLAHEQFHNLDGHLWRCGDRDPLWANVAQDIFIYHVLQDEGFETLAANEEALTKILHIQAKRNPVSGYAYDLHDFKGQFWEQVYETIAPAKQGGGGGDGEDDSEGDDQQDGSGEGDGDSEDDGQQGNTKSKGKSKGKPGMDQCGHCYKPGKPQDADSKETREQWKEWIRQAGTYAKMAGANPGRWTELVQAATPQVPFESHFYEFLKRGLGGDQSYDSFNRRFLHRGEYFPTDTMQVMGETVLVNDTSGSRTTEDMAYAYGVFKAWREQHPCKVHVVDVDTECAKWRTFEEFDELPEKWEAHGRGGTRFDTPFLDIAAKHIEPVALIYMTDGYNYGDFAPKPPYEVMWVLTGAYDKNFKPPYGTVVPVKQGHED
jgi:predicted metal-dependent peptidase